MIHNKKVLLTVLCGRGNIEDIYCLLKIKAGSCLQNINHYA